MSESELTPDDLLLLIDTSMMQMASLRRMVERYVSAPVMDDGRCKHLNQETTFTEVICRDCGETLASSDHGASPDQPETPGS